MYEPKTFTDQPRIFKNLTYAGRFRRRCNIEIFRSFSDKQIADGAADNISGISGIMQTGNNTERFVLYFFLINPMFRLRIYESFRHLLTRSILIISY